MKHIILLFLVFVIGYASWHLTTKKKRNLALKLGTKHGIAIAVFLAVLFVAVAAAVSFSSIKTI